MSLPMFKPLLMKWMSKLASQAATTVAPSICKLIPMSQVVSLATTGKFSRPFNCWHRTTNQYSKNFYIAINVNDYVEHRAEVLQSYAQKLASRALEEGRAQHTDPMSNSERKIIHRIVSKMDGVTSYSEGEEPNRYVVVDIEG